MSETEVGQVACVGLGGNLGERQANLDGAVAAIGATPGVSDIEVSDFFETEGEGGPPDQPLYLNGVLRCRTTLGAQDFLQRLLEIEREFGRDREQEVPNGPRPLDLDLLLLGDLCVDAPDLKLPHPRLEQRVFVLAPLAQLAPDLILPACGLSVSERLAQLEAQGQ